ncbi:MAG: phage tail sheath C-terminal domain-containing protein [Opitutaceae bacterium]
MESPRKSSARTSATPSLRIRSSIDPAALETTLAKSIAWVIFEPNGEALWVKVCRTISELLTAEWRKGALLGSKPEQAFFVRCDRTTMTQTEIDQGHLICLVGIAPVKPAEFVVFQISQWTADRKS